MVFRAKSVTEFLKQASPVPDAHALLVAMDPSGGGDSSMSLVTTSLKRNQITVVSSEMFCLL